MSALQQMWRPARGLLAALTWLTIASGTRAEVVQYTSRLEWENAVRSFTAVPYTNITCVKNVVYDVGLVTVKATGTGNTSISEGTNSTLRLSGSGTTAPWFRFDVAVKAGKVWAVGWDSWTGGWTQMYHSILIHDGGTKEYFWPGTWPAITRGFVGYVDTDKKKTISGFWFGSTAGANFTEAGMQNICLSNELPPRGMLLIVQ